MGHAYKNDQIDTHLLNKYVKPAALTVKGLWHHKSNTLYQLLSK